MSLIMFAEHTQVNVEGTTARRWRKRRGADTSYGTLYQKHKRSLFGLSYDIAEFKRFKIRKSAALR